MRLIRDDGQGYLHLVEYDEHKVPQYAILSHTWGKDDEEVTVQDFERGRNKRKAGCKKRKAGWKKIEFCRNQAARDNIKHFWIDTCCIVKENFTELHQAINSMFCWYQRAAKCYVYLADVSLVEQGKTVSSGDTNWKEAFGRSRWFRRGWTLQELLAPELVEFFSMEGDSLGSKQLLEQQIHNITGIAIEALRGRSLIGFPVAERFSWAKSRETKRQEDMAYSMLGIFDIHMPLIYGEGREKAFGRLKEEIYKSDFRLTEKDRLLRSLYLSGIDCDLQKDETPATGTLRLTVDDFADSPNMTERINAQCLQHLRPTDPRDDKTRIEQMKGGLLSDSYRWILDNADYRRWRDGRQGSLLWIKGDPGKGKTMLLCDIINELRKPKDRTCLLSFFFCQATDSRINSATAVLRGLIYLLVAEQPSLISHVREKYDHAGQELFEDANAWVALSEIFTNMLQDPGLEEIYIIIDALDECREGMSHLLDLIVCEKLYPSRAKWIVSSRNWPEVEERIEMTKERTRLCLELNADSISTAVSSYIRYRVDRLAQQKGYNSKTKADVEQHLSRNANGTFLWAALVCQNLEEYEEWEVFEVLTALPPGLDELYRRIMQKVNSSKRGNLLKQILALITAVRRPITLEEIASLDKIVEAVVNSGYSPEKIIRLCNSFLVLRERTIYFVHKSAQDFLLETLPNLTFPRGLAHLHYSIFTRSLEIMFRTLHRDMYRLGALGLSNETVQQPPIDPLVAVRYSCVYWVDHFTTWFQSEFAKGAAGLAKGGPLTDFFEQKFLYWLEALSLCGGISDGVRSIIRLEHTIKEKVDPYLIDIVRDGRRFLQSHKWVIENYPLQAYASALVFSPTRSLIRERFQQEKPTWIKLTSTIEQQWSTCLQTLEGHRWSVNSVIFSHDSKHLASASGNQTFKI